MSTITELRKAGESPSMEQLLNAIEDLESRAVRVEDLPMKKLQDRLETDWHPDGSILLENKSVTADKIAPPADWIVVGAAGAPAFTNGWVAFGGGLSVPAFYKDNLGNVVLKGQFMNGAAGTSMFTLPTGYRPLERRDFTSAYAGGDGGATVAVIANGTVIPAAGMGNVRISLDGIQFKAEA